jgi:hypothetical protein
MGYAKRRERLPVVRVVKGRQTKSRLRGYRGWLQKQNAVVFMIKFIGVGTWERLKRMGAQTAEQVPVAGQVAHLPSLLPCKTLVQESQDLRHIELHIFEIQVLLVVFLHLQEIVELEIQLQQASRTSWD